jgi:hypothetical protein
MVKNFDLEKNLCNSLESIEIKSKQNNSILTTSTRHQSLSSSVAHLERSNAYASSIDLFSSPLRALDKSVLLKNWQVDPDKPQIASRIRFPSYKPLTTEEILKFMSPNNRHLLQDDMIVNRLKNNTIRLGRSRFFLTCSCCFVDAAEKNCVGSKLKSYSNKPERKSYFDRLKKND